ncbi:type VII secretion protein EccB [Mycolicibacterium confluentis]|uniref:ESX-3 secretion system ATPase EccB3 n=1 Tax=Mycolicibacterium confluentis TaxID=28047 RepID=A0A7I7Y3X7_9MYCO|nr:type VII secretion protein EccB [Mycolicibacterium confluentis]MCV7320668.1 type VII secretion protein EccB [Mycolicibacterium confluentis]ORV30312.1 type VII secretion protein EccB [Mycolicibacterium confluentis]BBZ35712.1 ESX-3 secretion system ATPase EccB3 [Mycolicibacterium confluentis]
MSDDKRRDGNAEDSERRSFTSRTPENTNLDAVTYRRGFVTRHQVTGWRFVMRRLASGVALHDTRMLVDPLRTQTRGVVLGALIVVTGLLGCLIFSWIRPGGTVGGSVILADRDSSALYVQVNGKVHPVLNLTSARLIAGAADKPTAVRSAQLDELPRGAMIGIAGAPERMVQNASRDGDWTVCDGVGSSYPGVTVIAGAPAEGSERAAKLAADHAILVSSGGGAWLLWDGRRSPIDLADRAVTSALGLSSNVPAPRSISPGLFNAIPESQPLRAPVIPEAGGPAGFPLPVPAPVGAVVVAYGTDGSVLHYAVLPDGLQPVSPVLAALLRNTNSYGLDQPPRLDPDEIANLPESRLLDTASYPAQQLTLVDPASAPISCVRWTKAADASTSSLTLLSGASLPIADNVRPLDLTPGGATTATRVALPVGTGYLTQTVGQEPASPIAGSLFWIADTGVRYGIEADNAEELAKTVGALGLTPPPADIPWSVLSLFAPGPALSKADALTAYASNAGTETR